MKSFEQIRKEVRQGDRQLIADALGISKSLVSMVLNYERTDRHNIQLAFNILLKQREDLKKQVKQQKQLQL
jgi:predicted transcriptional regulator